MLLTANEGRQQHAFFIPQLGPAPKWCAFLDNIVEEMAEDPDDPNAFNARSAGEIYDNFKFLTVAQLRQLNLDHLIGTTSLLRPYMHGYFVAQKLYEEARLISNPDLWQEQRAKSIQEKIQKERESRIRGSKKAAVKVNRKLAERLLEREEKAERRRAQRVLEKGGDDDMLEGAAVKAPAVGGDAGADADVDMDAEPTAPAAPKTSVLNDPRFARLFEDEDFQVDEESHEFQAINPSTKLPKGLTAVEQEELESRRGSSSDEDSDESEDERRERRAAAASKQKKKPSADDGRISTSSYKKAGHNKERGPQMVVSSSNNRTGGKNRRTEARDKTFGARVEKLRDTAKDEGKKSSTVVVGEREITFKPEGKSRKRVGGGEGQGVDKGKERQNFKDRRSASGNVFRRM
jgi:ribosome biogenesis protein ENP2